MPPRTLKTVVFFGSARDIYPPWGGPSRLGDRVLSYVLDFLSGRKVELGGEEITHDITVYDPLEVFAKDGHLGASGGELKHPSFFYKSDDVPEGMKTMQDTIEAADCFLIVSPEYNHSIPPALTSMMGHFGGSKYAYKMSGIISYSSGPYGGARGAVALRPFLSELGCLPVSKMCLFSSVSDILDEAGSPKDSEHRMLKQLPGLLEQLEWTTVAFARMKETSPPK